jgi:lysophospholipase L1-like esterase
MVGSLNGPSCPVQYDADNDGHWGYLVTDVVAGSYKRPQEGTFEQWLAKANPDVLFMHFGTNDCWNNKPVTSILAAYEKILNAVRAKNAKASMVLCKLIGHNPSGCGDCDQRVQRLNAQMDDWATSHSKTDSPIYVADCHTGFNPSTDTQDGTHPNLQGMQKMAKAMTPALEKALDHWK